MGCSAHSTKTGIRWWFKEPDITVVIVITDIPVNGALSQGMQTLNVNKGTVDASSVI